MRALTGLDIQILVEELQTLEGTKVEDVYHIDKTLYIKLAKKKLGQVFLKIKSGSLLCLTNKREKSKEMTQFAKILRRHLKDSTLKAIKQLGHERIVDILFESREKYVLVCEFFSKGNIILTSPAFQIIYALRRAKEKERDIAIGKKYKLPVPPVNPFKIKGGAFEAKLRDSEEKNVVQALAVEFSLGKIYAEEICKRANVDTERKPDQLDIKEIRDLYTELKGILSQVKKKKKNPYVFVNEKIKAFPFTFEISPKATKRFDTYNKAINYADEYNG